MKKKNKTSPTIRLIRRRLWLLASAFILFVASCATDTDVKPVIGTGKTSPTVIDNPDLLKGQLKNGMEYFILQNGEPSNRIFFRLVVNAGSLMERPDQLGFAHFVEHAAFLGTGEFSENEIVGYLESLGMRFGPDINAYTSFDETVYMLQVPADDPSKIERGLHILQQWAHAVGFPDERIIRERGVIQEEWRVGQGAQQRLRDAHFPVIFKDSLYAERLPIGEPDIFMQADSDGLREFYKTWYRPDLMAIVAVGDFDPETMEAMIRDTFSFIPTTGTSITRPQPEIPPQGGSLISSASDPELTYSSITIYNRQPSLILTHEEDYRTRWIHELFASALARRVEEREMNPDFPMLAAGAGFSELVRTRDAAYLYAVSETELLIPALEELIGMILEIQQHGFSEGEADAARRQLIRSYQDAYNERDFLPSNYFAGQLSETFLKGGAAPGIIEEWELAQRIIPGITNQQIQEVADIYLQENDQIITLSVPEYYEASLPTNEEIAALVADLRTRQVENPGPIERQDTGLMDEFPLPGRIIADEYLEEIGVHEWTLSNNMQVYLLPTEFRSDEIILFSYTLGGHSLVEDEKFHSSNLATSTAWLSGLGDLSRTELNSLLDGKSVDISSYIDFYDHGFYGSSSRDDREMMFQLAHLHSSKPRLEEDGFNFLMRHVKASLESRQADPNAVFADSLQDLVAGENIRYKSIREQDITQVNFADVRKIYLDRFADLRDSSFFIVGAFQPEEMVDLVETYIASLPSGPDQAQRIPRANGFSLGVIEHEISHGQADSSRSAIVFRGEFDGSIRSNYLITALTDSLRIRLREVLREDEGGTYGVSVNHSGEYFPLGTYQIHIDFNTAPERVDGLTALVHQELERYKAEGPDMNLIQRVQETHRRDHETNLKSNDWWLWEMYRYHQQELNLLDIPQQSEWIEDLSPEVLQNAAISFLPADRYIQLIMRPEQ